MVCETQVAIVNPDTSERCSSDGIGEVWIADPGVAQGYWQRDEATRETFAAYVKGGEGPFLRTGDLGFIEDKEARHECRCASRSHDGMIDKPFDTETLLSAVERTLEG